MSLHTYQAAHRYIKNNCTASTLSQTISAFYEAVQEYYPYEQLLVEALAVIETGVRFLQAVKAWWQNTSTKLHP